MRSTIRRQANTLDRIQGSRAELVEAITTTVSDALAGLEIPPVTPPSTASVDKHDAKREETAIALLGDLQLAKVTADYNTEVCEERVLRYAERICHMAAIQRADHPVRKVRVYMLGDMIEGEMIFPHQAHLIDRSLYKQVTVDGPRILARFLRELLANFEEVHVAAVPGNHGRIGTKHQGYHPETNADRMLYEITRQIMEGEERLTWDIAYKPHETGWYTVDYPFGKKKGHGFLLFHGDQISNASTCSTRTIATRIWGWASGAVKEQFDYAVWGHWHSPKRIEMNAIIGWCNGSTESTNTFAQERLSAMGDPKQLLMFVHPRVGVTAEYWVQLRKKVVS